MLCETKNGKTVLIFEEVDCEPFAGNCSLWDTALLPSLCVQGPSFFLGGEMMRGDYDALSE